MPLPISKMTCFYSHSKYFSFVFTSNNSAIFNSILLQLARKQSLSALCRFQETARVLSHDRNPRMRWRGLDVGDETRWLKGAALFRLLRIKDLTTVCPLQFCLHFNYAYTYCICRVVYTVNKLVTVSKSSKQLK